MLEVWVANASPVILLAKAEAFGLLAQLPGQLVVPRGVFAEVTAAGPADPGAVALGDPTGYQLVEIAAVHPNVAGWDLGRGESEVLTWALDNPPAIAVLDDRQARAAARSLGVRTIGTIGVVVRARRAGHIVSARAMIERLRAEGLRLGEAIFEEALRLARELPPVP